MRHIMTYTIAGGRSFNIVLNHPDDTDPSTWNPDSAVEDMKEHFRDWDPQFVAGIHFIIYILWLTAKILRITRLIHMIDQPTKWPLTTGDPITRWIAPSGKLLILGDAAHAMLPYMSQGISPKRPTSPSTDGESIN